MLMRLQPNKIMLSNIHKSQKLSRQERINYLKSSLNVIRNLRYSRFKENSDRNFTDVVFDSRLEKPLYSWWKIAWDIIIGINIRK